MKITKITLKNFQSYKNEEFLMKDVMIILRENGAGKSAFLKALNFALCGEGCDDSMITQGEKEMCVSILFENGLIIERKRKLGDKTITHRVGYKKPKNATKDAVNAEISKLCGTEMSSIKVIASSKELFEMKPDVLADFIMRHIPNRMTVENVISYIPDITDRMREEIKKQLPAGTEFGHEDIQKAFVAFDTQRKDLSRDVKLNKAKITGYDFSVPVRDSEEIRKTFATAFSLLQTHDYLNIGMRSLCCDNLLVLSNIGFFYQSKETEREFYEYMMKVTFFGDSTYQAKQDNLLPTKFLKKEYLKAKQKQLLFVDNPNNNLLRDTITGYFIALS